MRTVVYVNLLIGWLAKIAFWFGYRITKATVQNRSDEITLWQITNRNDTSNTISRMTNLIGPTKQGSVRVTGITRPSFEESGHQLCTVVYINLILTGWLARVAFWFGYRIIKVTFQNGRDEIALWQITNRDDTVSRMNNLIGPIKPGFIQVTGIGYTSFEDAYHKLNAHWFALGGVL